MKTLEMTRYLLSFCFADVDFILADRFTSFVRCKEYLVKHDLIFRFAYDPKN